MLDALIAEDFALPAGCLDLKPDDFAGKQKNKKHRADDQRQLNNSFAVGLKNKNRGYYTMCMRICKAIVYYKCMND